METKTLMDFAQLDLGSNAPISVKLETIEVVVTAKDMVAEYARSFVKEANRLEPERNKQVCLTEDEMVAYAKYLLFKRVQAIHGECTDWNRLKTLFIPVFLQYALRMIGEVTKRDIGLKIVPVVDDSEMADVIDFKTAVEISEKIAFFERSLSLVQDAMPRGIDGDPNVMSTALVAGYVRSMIRVEHVADTYVSAFLGMKLREEMAFQVLYRIQYDDIDFIAAALTHNPRLYR